MPDSNWRQQHSPSPKATPFMQPPLSKFYHGPVTGWNSAESSPSHDGPTFSVNPTHEFVPSLPPRGSPGPSGNASPKPSQGWHSPVPSATTSSQISSGPYKPHQYAAAPESSDTAVNPTWDSGPTDTSTWGVNYRAKYPQIPNTLVKPPLPPRPHQIPHQPPLNSSKIPASRSSATTIDVPLFLQPLPYESVSVPPLPGQPIYSPQESSSQASSPPKPQRVPPLPPRKIPLDQTEVPKNPKMIPKRPQYDPQQSFDPGQTQTSQKPRRPRFDPQHSHNHANEAGQQQHLDRQPTIPAPHFTSFDVESALPPVQYDHEPSPLPLVSQFQANSSPHNLDNDCYHAKQHLHQSSISSVGTLQQDSWTSSPTAGNSRAPYVPSPQQHINPSQQDEQSKSATDSSSNAPGKATPDSQQTSNTSYNDGDNRLHPNGEGQQGDDSFYWHSGRSSSDADEEHTPNSSPIATPGETSTDQRSSTTNSTVVQREPRDLPIRSTSLSPSAPYGASALGFGGPSDWEYFGDYEAEEIDDEELYSRPRAKDDNHMFAEFAELPADDHSIENATQLAGESETPASNPILQEVLPSHEGGSVKQLKTIPSSEIAEQESPVINLQTKDKLLNLEDSHRTPRPKSNGYAASSDQPSEQRLDLDDVIRAWSEAPDVGRLSAGSLRLQSREDIDIQSQSQSQSHDFADASLASTSREKNLGASLVPGSASSLPPLPAFSDQSAALEEQSRPDHDSSSTSSNVPSISQGSEQQELQASHSKQLESYSSKSLHDTEQAHQPNQAKEEAGPEDNGHSLSKSNVSSVPYEDMHTQSMSSKSSSVIQASSSKPEGPSTDTIESHSDTTTDTIIQVNQPDVQTKSLPETSATESAPVETKTFAILQEISPTVNRLPEANSQDFLHEPQESRLALQASTQFSEPKPAELQDPVSREFPPGAQTDLPEKGHLDLSSEAQSYKPPSEQSERVNDPLITQSKQQKAAMHLNSDEIIPAVPTKAGANEADVATERELMKLHGTEEKGQTPQLVTPSIGLRHSIESSSNADKMNDPYADLDPWGKASLNRFAAMLREESRAETNKDKLNIFNVFTSRESRLRVVLYGTEDELVSPQKGIEHDRAVPKPQEATKVPELTGQIEKTPSPEKSGFVKQAVQRANTMSLQRSLKALPALPTNRGSVVGLPGNALAPLVVDDDSRSMVDRQSPSSDTSIDGAQYSPGGRPIVTQTLRKSEADTGKTPSKTLVAHEATAGAKDTGSPRSIAPIAIESNGTVEVAKKAAYSPSKYNEPRSEVKNYLANRKSVIRPYATLTQGSMDSGSNFGRGLDVGDAPSTNTTISAPTSQYNSISKLNKGDFSDATIKLQALANEPKTDLRRFVKADFDPLLTILPHSEAAIPESPRLDGLRSVMETIPDDFSFIHQSVVAWDAKAKKQREENDRQRHIRQIESEQRIDSLFDDHEIGYGDISELEAEFKRSEAARKADEDRSEYQMFVSDVFTLVWTRLHYELDQLVPHYEQYSKLMNGTLAGKDMFDESSEGLALAPTMNLVLTLHQKLEIRHQKAFEAVLERDRRLKKTEISPWYTLSNIIKVKQLEKQFEDAEKKAIIEYCQQRNTRANRLMDVLDQNTLRGVGTNQDYMEAIWKAVRRIASGRAFASVSGSNDPTAGMEEVEKAKGVTALLATSSEQIVQTFHVADMLLNSADYEVSVARAKVTDKMDLAALAKLKEERAKEDQKLMRDLEHRLALIREDTRRTNDEIVKLMLFLGVSNGRADSAPAVYAGLGDPDHELRLQKALQEAKERNALKESGN